MVKADVRSRRCCLPSGASGSFRLFDGTTTLLVQWAQESDWVEFGGNSSGATDRWTFPIAYSSAPAILGFNSYQKAGTVQQGYGVGAAIQPTVTATYVAALRSYSSFGGSDVFYRSGNPIAIGVPA